MLNGIIEVYLSSCSHNPRCKVIVTKVHHATQPILAFVKVQNQAPLDSYILNFEPEENWQRLEYHLLPQWPIAVCTLDIRGLCGSSLEPVQR